MVFLSTSQPKAVETENLYLLQKQHDLLKLWAKKGIPPIGEMAADFNFVFSGKNGMIKLDGRAMEMGPAGKEAIASEMVFIGSGMRERHLSLTVFKG